MKVFAQNRRARFDYEILETLEAGISLTGHEAKSIKSGHISITGAHVIIRGGDAYVIGMEIPSFQPKNAPQEYDEDRTRKLLLKKEELRYLTGKMQSNLTLVPIKLYSKKAFLKLELGLARGRKKYDKREVIKKRETKREIKKAVDS